MSCSPRKGFEAEPSREEKQRVMSEGALAREKRALHVTVTNPVQCSLHGRKCTVSVETKLNQSQPDFTKHRSGFVLCVPGN
ncbi:hypothetical protein DUI87_22063 [Hirundo rustica rustica]|uniref:Uncharacterized protein n=1 Tax=Hirundo rustica rustica TaxID=333673 RepID=A0A3M0JKM5_HIRRU|nr:hypothetical protein DUI87_22063 [Hirundo rustica rustica]